MKKIRFIISLFVILLLLAVSTVGMFSLPTNNIDDRKANVAIVNEDNGSVLNGETVVFGNDFTKLFVRNTDGKYEVTSRTAALEGLSSQKYDLVIIVPSDFTQKAMTYNSKEPEAAFLEYIKSPTASQVSALKSEVLTKILKETANKVLVETFTFEILKTMQGMQEKSLGMMDNELEYQTYFKNNVEFPVADSMANFNGLVDQLSSQQTALTSFDTGVEGFNTTIKAQDEKEQVHLTNFENLKEKYKKMSDVLNQWSDDYNGTLNLMTSDTYLKTLEDAQETGIANIQQLIKDVKKSTIALELQIKAITDYKAKLEELKKKYDEVKASGVINEQIPDSSDQLAVEIHNKLTRVTDQVNKFMAPGSAITDALGSITKGSSQRTKAKFEVEFAQACQSLPTQLGVLPSGYTTEDFTAAKNFCALSQLPTDDAPVEGTKVVYKQTQGRTINGNNSFYSIQNANPKVSYFYDRVEQNLHDQNMNPTGMLEKFEGDAEDREKLTLKTEYYEERLYSTNEDILSDQSASGGEIVTSRIFGVPQDSVTFTFEHMSPVIYKPDGSIALDGFRPKQKEAIDSIQQLKSLSKVYYGKTLQQLGNDYFADGNKVSPLPSDAGISGQTPGIQKFRPYANIVRTGLTYKDENGNTIDCEWDGSLIAQVEKIFDNDLLKKELTKAIAEQLSTQTNDVMQQMDGYIRGLQSLTAGALDTTQLPSSGIYTDDLKGELIEASESYYQNDASVKKQGLYNEAITKMESHLTETTNLKKQLKDFNNNFKEWVSSYTEISNDTVQITSLKESDNQIVLSLEEKQKDLLTGLGDLQKQIDGQMTQTKEIVTSSETLKKESDKSRTQIDESIAKLSNTKTKFDNTLNENQKFVDQFIKKYASALNGGADNQAFYQNYAQPVELKGKDAQNTNSLVAFFIILLMTVFSLVIAYFFNQWRIKKTNTSEHHDISMFSGLATQLGLVVVASILAGSIVGYIGVQALAVKDVSMILWFALITGIAITFTMTFYMLLLRFKTYGIMLIGMIMLMYFITNGALGLNINANPNLSWIQWLNPLIYFEQPLQNIIFQKEVELLPIFAILFLVTIMAVALIYLLQPLAYKQEMKEIK